MQYDYKRIKLALCLGLWLCWLSPGVMATPVLIHHPDLQNESFTTSTLVRIYAMQKRVWSDNTPIKVFTLPKDNPVHKEFVTNYLRMQPYQLGRLWHRLVFSGTGTKPQEMSSVEMMVEKIKSTPGAIGYIDSSMLKLVDDSMTAEFKP